MPQRAINCLFMRGGSSRGPYMLRSDLPEGERDLVRALAKIVGAGHPLNIDGVGGGAAVTTKTALLSPSDDAWADVDYLFAQVKVDEPVVDFGPTCGNMASGVGPAAIEMGLVTAQSDYTRVKIRAVNTGARIEAVVQTPGGKVEYEGNARIDGVPGTAAPVILNFLDIVGSKTGRLLPTGAAVDEIDGVPVSCIDVAMPVVIARARDLGVNGHEAPADLDANQAFLGKLEAIRVKAGRLMGMGDVAGSVIPKFAVVSEPAAGGTLAARYMMPWKCHPSMAVTGAICLGSSVLVPGAVSRGVATPPSGTPTTVGIEHPSGLLELEIDYEVIDEDLSIKRVGLLRTTRLLMRGEIMEPGWTRG